MEEAPKNPASPAPASIALFGGTFDPVHLGHLEIATRAVEALRLDQVRFIPCRISPHKKTAPTASEGDRFAMLELATRGIPWAVADDLEIRRSGPSYSYLTAEAIRARFPRARLHWILGRDQWDALPRWREPERLASIVRFIVFGRDGAPRPRPGWEMTSVEGRHPASATVIREAIRRGERPPDWLPPGIADYIAENHLYRD